MAKISGGGSGDNGHTGIGMQGPPAESGQKPHLVTTLIHSGMAREKIQLVAKSQAGNYHHIANKLGDGDGLGWINGFALDELEKLLIKNSIYITKPQAIILIYLLLQRPQCITRYELVASASHTTTGGVRAVVRAIKNKGFIYDVMNYGNPVFKGIQYTINNDACSVLAKFIAEHGSIQNPHQRHIEGLVRREKVEPKPDRRAIKPEVQNNGVPEKGLRGDPAFIWWKEQGVNEKVINKWQTEFGLSEDILLEYLKYAYFYVVHTDEGSSVDKPDGYFYKTIKNDGRFKKPKGYMSQEELEVKIIEEETRAREEAIEKMRVAREKRYLTETQYKAEICLNDPSSEGHKKILAKMDKFARSSPPGSALFDNSFKAAFRELFEEAASKGLSFP